MQLKVGMNKFALFDNSGLTYFLIQEDNVY